MPAIVMQCVKAEQHPNADALKLYSFEAPEQEPVQIIANLDNVYEVGDKAVVVLAGSVMKDGTKIKPTKLRGVPSYGMVLGHSDQDVGTDLSDEHCQPDAQVLKRGTQMIAWPDIESLFNVRRGLKAVEEERAIEYRGKVKLDGTNAGVQLFPDGRIVPQSRSRILDPDSDNMNFAKWVVPNYGYFEQVRKLANEKGYQDQHLTIFGEWCFYHDTPVMLADGSSRKIGEIVNKKEKLEVLSYNFETKRLEPKRIVGWSRHPDNGDWITITVKRRHRGGKSTRLIVTNPHSIFCKKDSQINEVPASEIKPGDVVFVHGKTVGYYQEQFIMGSLLGDGSFADYGMFTCSHSETKQGFYNVFIEQLLSEIVSVSTAVSGHGSNMKVFNSCSLPFIKDLYDTIKIDEVKRPTRLYLNKMHPPAFAAWYMDDGGLCCSGHNRQCQCELRVFFPGEHPVTDIPAWYRHADLFTQGYSDECNSDLVSWFNDHGFECYLLTDSKNQRYIRFTPSGTEAFLRTIAPYVIEGFNYKLSPHLRNVPKINWDHAGPINGIIETEVVCVEEGNPYSAPYKRQRYDITVADNHNYFANKVLVHNCGKGIQKRTAISKIDRQIFAVFAMQIDPLATIETEPSKLRDVLPQHDQVFIIPWYVPNGGSGDMLFDFTNVTELEKQAERLNEIVAAVEKCDPFVKDTFGIEGLGEGVVMYPIIDGSTRIDRMTYSDLVFKAKGEKHKVVNSKKPAQIDPEFVATVDNFVDLFVTENRLEQIAQKVLDGKDFSPALTGPFIKAFGQDVLKESKAELETSGLEWKQVAKAINSKAVGWWKAKCDSLG